MQLFRPVDSSESNFIDDISKSGVAVISELLTQEALEALLDEAETLGWAVAPKVYGKTNNVHQSYAFSCSFQPEGGFHMAKRALQAFLNDYLKNCDPQPLSQPLVFNQARIQRYEPSEIGISMHRDGDSNRDLVALLVLDAGGVMYIFNDQGKELRQVTIRNSPGDLILLRANGFGGQNIQPKHCVHQIESRRTTFALRSWYPTAR